MQEQEKHVFSPLLFQANMNIVLNSCSYVFGVLVPPGRSYRLFFSVVRDRSESEEQRLTATTEGAIAKNMLCHEAVNSCNYL